MNTTFTIPFLNEQSEELGKAFIMDEHKLHIKSNEYQIHPVDLYDTLSHDFHPQLEDYIEIMMLDKESTVFDSNIYLVEEDSYKELIFIIKKFNKFTNTYDPYLKMHYGFYLDPTNIYYKDGDATTEQEPEEDVDDVFIEDDEEVDYQPLGNFDVPNDDEMDFSYLLVPIIPARILDFNPDNFRDTE